MKKAMSGFDLRAWRELDALKGAYIKKAYMPHYEQIVLRVNPKEAEQRDIVFVRGERVYTSQRDRPMPMTPPPFAMVLRKHLRNARLTGVEQVGFDRVLALRFDTKTGNARCTSKCSGTGNIILVDEEGVIVQPLTHASYAGRTLKKGVSYTPPPAATDPYALDEASLGELLMASDRDLVSTLGGKAVGWVRPTPTPFAHWRHTSQILRPNKPMEKRCLMLSRPCCADLRTARKVT